MDNAFKKVVGSNQSVKLDDYATKNGDVSTEITTDETRKKINVTVKPRDGYKVKSVTWRGYNAGDDVYTSGEAILSTTTGEWGFYPTKGENNTAVENVIVFVEYEQTTSENNAEKPDDLFGQDGNEDMDVDIDQLMAEKRAIEAEVVG